MRGLIRPLAGAAGWITTFSFITAAFTLSSGDRVLS